MWTVDSGPQWTYNCQMCERESRRRDVYCGVLDPSREIRINERASRTHTTTKGKMRKTEVKI